MILYNNKHYLIAEKPRGMVVHATIDLARPHFFSELQKEMLEKKIEGTLGLHHRLDKETSGLMVFSLSKEGAKVLDQLFRSHQIRKIYTAIVEGDLSPTEGEWTDRVSIKKKHGKEYLTRDKSGVLAQLKYCQKEILGNQSLVEFELITGKRHQIRAQSSWRGHALINDHFYGAVGGNQKSFYLHSTVIKFFDPILKEEMNFQSPVPFSLEQSKSQNKAIVFYKPYGVVCQFSGDDSNLSAFLLPKDFYAAGRLDKDSEGLLALSNRGSFIDRISSPKFLKSKTYWVQVENIPQEDALLKMREGLEIADYKTLPCQVRILAPNEYAEINPRTPPIRERKTIPTCWLEIILNEGRNRQVRHMTAKIGHPTLRLIRVRIGRYSLLNEDFSPKMLPGEWKWLSEEEIG